MKKGGMPEHAPFQGGRRAVRGAARGQKLLRTVTP